MNVLSSVEFELLAKTVTPRLKALSRAKCDRDPKGFVTLADVDAYINACQYSGDIKATNWLKSLKTFAMNGTLGRIRKGTDKWENHVLAVELLHRKGEIKFKLGDSVMVKESGKYGQVIDYLPDEKEYIVVLDPFQMANLKSGDIERVAAIEKSGQMEEESAIMNLQTMEDVMVFVDNTGVVDWVWGGNSNADGFAKFLFENYSEIDRYDYEAELSAYLRSVGENPWDYGLKKGL